MFEPSSDELFTGFARTGMRHFGLFFFFRLEPVVDTALIIIDIGEADFGKFFGRGRRCGTLKVGAVDDDFFGFCACQDFNSFDKVIVFDGNVDGTGNVFFVEAFFR